MRILLAGGSGAIARQLIPLLTVAGHDVFATTRKRDRQPAIAAIGGEPILLDALDRSGVLATIASLRPEIILHQLTDLADGPGPGNATLRIQGTRNLVDAARATGVSRMIAQSIAWVVAPGATPATEDEPLDPDLTEPRAGTIAAVRALEDATFELDRGIVLRYGQLYGPGTWYARDGKYGLAAMNGDLPATPAIATFLHIHDAARAAVAALDWPPGLVNIVDDLPAPGTDWVPAFAAALDAPSPQVEDGPATGRAISNAKMRAFGFSLAYPTWQAGFRTLQGSMEISER
jgi:nucleoside-diphosphate-sugar epimerase